MKHGFIPSDPAALARVPRYRFGAVAASPGSAAAPSTTSTGLDRSSVPFVPQPYYNTEFPDCVTAALANCMCAVAVLNGFNFNLLHARPLDWYGFLLGLIPEQNPPFDPSQTMAAQLAATAGISPLTVLNALASPGFNTGKFTDQTLGLNAAGSPIITGSYGLVIPEIAELSAALKSALGPGLWCFNFNSNDIVNQGPGKTWDVSSSDAGLPWVEGHAMMAWDFTGTLPTDTVRFATWGGWKLATWQWVMSRIAGLETYAIQVPQLVIPGWYSSLPPGIEVPL